MLKTRLDTARIQAAHRIIDPIFLDTPLYRCEALEPDLGCTVSIKLETAHPVRSFKARGTEVVASQLADSGARAVICASAGNLGQALAQLRIRCLAPEASYRQSTDVPPGRLNH